MMWRILFIVAVATSFAAGQITVTPDFDKVINEGDTTAFTYKCQNGDVSSTEYPVWKDKDDNVIQTSGGGASNRVYASESVEGPYHVTRLSFENVEMSENGNYTCSLGTDIVRRQVIVAIPISFPLEAVESSQRLLVEATGQVHCTINSNPFPKIFWYVNSQLINEQDTTDRYTMSTQTVTEPGNEAFEHAEKAILEVSNVDVGDTGSYRCFASVDQTGDSLSLTMEVIVQVPPEWTVEPQNVQAVEGSDIDIQCAASGTPEPTYTWSNEDGPIVDTPGKFELRSDGEFLKVMSLTPDDDQLYTCIASNDAINSTYQTDIQKTFRLEVQIPPSLNNQNNQTVVEGEAFTMDCFITNPNAVGTLSWRRYGVTDEDIVNEGTWTLDPRVSVTASADGNTLTLSLNPSNYDHSGGWTCYAESDAGHAMVTHYLSVESAPFVDYSVTDFRVLSWPANPVNMTCAFKGYPAPSIRWYVGGWVLNETDSISFMPGLPGGTSIVTIVPTQADFGPYTCEARNRVDSSNVRIDLVEGTVASEPQNVILTDTTSSTIRVLYEEPENDGGFDVLYYTLAYRTENGANMTREYDNITDVVLDSLSGSTRYYVYVAAVNERGIGHYSEPVSTTTLALTVTEQGGGHFSEPVSTTTLALIVTTVPGKATVTSGEEAEYGDRYRLTWRAPMDNGGSPIISYHIKYSTVDGITDTTLSPRPEEIDVNAPALEVMITGLSENKFYRAEVMAENERGRSEPAGINFKTRGGFVFPTEEPQRPEQQIGALATTEIVAIVVACFIILLILIDVCCFCMNDCGILMFICVNCCGKEAPSAKDEIEMGDEEYGGAKTAPPAGESPPTYQVLENGKAEENVESSQPAEAEPLVNKDGSVLAANDDTDSPILEKGESGQGDCVKVETETSAE